MREEAVNTQIPVDLTPKVGPGPALREARESRNVSLDTVAKQLRIDPELVRALEKDDYSKFAAPIYVTGHLRAYARVLGLPPESFIEAYQNLGSAAPPSLARVAHLDDNPEPTGNAQVPRWVMYLMIIAVVAVVLFVWRAEVMKLLTSFKGSSLMVETPVASLQSSGAGTGNTAGNAVTQQSLSLPSLPEKTSTPLVSKPVAPATEAKQAAAPPQPQLPLAHLSLKADKPSWVEIKDGNGKRLFYDLMVPGDEHSLDGVSPFNVLLGYGPGITVEYNGKRVDHSMYERQDVARFKVGDKGTSRK